MLVICIYDGHYTHAPALLTFSKPLIRLATDANVNFGYCYYKFNLPITFFVVLLGWDLPYDTTDYYLLSIYGRSILNATVGEASLKTD